MVHAGGAGINFMEIAYHRFGLKLRGPAGGNVRSGRRVLEGFLIRVDDGYGSVQPWPELGDGSLEEQWQLLRSGGRTPLLERALACAAADGAARRAGRSLLGNVKVPDSHATVSGEADFASLAAEGFKAVKLKGGQDWRVVVERMRLAAEAGLRLRVDFNGVLTPALFLEFGRAAADLIARVDFIEDPVPYDELVWQGLQADSGLPLALDRALGRVGAGFDVRVWKPAVETQPLLLEPVVVTSYMDHPVGQVFAAWESACFQGRQELAGLLTHRLFEPDAFTERLAASGPQWISPGGSGLGFDDLLSALPWIPLSHRGSLAGRVLQNPRDPLPDGGPVLEVGQVGFATSGSTGMPSVVVHTEETLEASARAVNRWLEVRAEDVWLRALPDFHVGGYQIGLRAALAGSRVAVDDAKWDAGGFAGICAREVVSLTSLVPAQLVDLVRRRLQAPACLRALVVGGGALDEGFRRDALDLGWPVLPSYGASEAGSQVATARPGKLGSLGAGMIVLPEWEARVSGGGNGGDGWPGDPGKAGVLELRGAALAVGRFIWQDGAWTRRKLADAQGWWRSSDRVFLNGRELEFEGRVDRVVKVLGELVNLEAVGRALEAAGLLHGGFTVIALPGERRGSELVLVVETRLGDVGHAVQVYQEASAPFAMIMRVVQVAELPRSPLGKIRYAALAALIPPGVP